MDPTYPLFPILAFLGFILVLIPFPWHLQASNSGTCLFMAWTAAALLNKFINAVVWHNNIVDWAPIWCDISTRIDLASGLGITAASLCISKRLHHIATCQSVSTSREDKRRALIIDLLIGVGIPFIELPLHIIVNGHRYDILEDVGCQLITYNVVPAYPLTFIWTNVLCVISATYCVLTLRAFLRRRAQFNQFLTTSNSALTANRYFRLMALASVEILVNVPVSTYGLYINISQGVHPWISWADTHSGWLIVDRFPAILWRANSTIVTAIELPRWATVLVAFIFFGFFGFADEARKNYRMLGLKLRIIKPAPPRAFQLPLSVKTVGSGPSPRANVKRSDSVASSTVIASPSINKDFDLESGHGWKDLPTTPVDEDHIYLDIDIEVGDEHPASPRRHSALY